MAAAQSCVDVISKQIDQVTGQITKANVGVKTAERYVLMVVTFTGMSLKLKLSYIHLMYVIQKQGLR